MLYGIWYVVDGAVYKDVGALQAFGASRVRLSLVSLRLGLWVWSAFGNEVFLARLLPINSTRS